MEFYIVTQNDGGTGMKYNTKEDFLKELGLMIDDCMSNGGTYIDLAIDSDASFFCCD